MSLITFWGVGLTRADSLPVFVSLELGEREPIPGTFTVYLSCAAMAAHDGEHTYNNHNRQLSFACVTNTSFIGMCYSGTKYTRNGVFLWITWTGLLRRGPRPTSIVCVRENRSSTRRQLAARPLYRTRQKAQDRLPRPLAMRSSTMIACSFAFNSASIFVTSVCESLTPISRRAMRAGSLAGVTCKV
jgi:hypothetical protein